MKKLIVSVSLLLGVGIFLGIYNEKLENKSKKIGEINLNIEEFQKVPEKKIVYSLYIPDEKISKLEKIEEELNYSDNRTETIKIIVNKLFYNLKEKKILSSDIQLKNIFIRDNEIYLNFFSWKENNEKKNLYILYAITNSLAENLGDIKVKFLINDAEGKGIFSQYYEKNLNI